MAAGGGGKLLRAVYPVIAATAKLDRPCFVVGQVLRCGLSRLLIKWRPAFVNLLQGQIEGSFVRLQGQSLYDGFVSLMVRSGKSPNPRNNGKNSDFLSHKGLARVAFLHLFRQELFLPAILSTKPFLTRVFR